MPDDLPRPVCRTSSATDGCILLTGATGLLGRYLVRDLSAAGVSLAVLVRPDRSKNPVQRVKALLDDWQARTGVRPRVERVLSGDLREEGLGLSREERSWAAGNVAAIVHNAASLAFREGAGGEPFASNVAGTRHVLGLCGQIGVRTMHYVLTAYVAGRAAGVVFEGPPASAVPPGNVYEDSKRQAEMTVRAAAADGLLDAVTYLRPGIIVGDSRTGLTTTFHGFYAFLRVVALIARTQQEAGETATLRLTLDGTERKHLVPVDWVSAAITAVVTNSALHGGTYHLTPAEPVTTEKIKDAVQAVSGVGPLEWVGAAADLSDAAPLEKIFYHQTRIYQNYWRNDPAFDRTNIVAALPDLPCPPITPRLLERLASAAMRVDFRHRDRSHA